MGISAIKEFIDDKFYSTLMNKIKIEVKVALNELITSDDDRIHKFIVKNQESNLNENEDLITILKKGIEFLRKELQSKDLIINDD